MGWRNIRGNEIGSNQTNFSNLSKELTSVLCLMNLTFGRNFLYVFEISPLNYFHTEGV